MPQMFPSSIFLTYLFFMMIYFLFFFMNYWMKLIHENQSSLDTPATNKKMIILKIIKW